MIDFFARFPVWLLLLLSASGVIAGDYFAKFWSTNQRTVFAVCAVVGYALSSLFYIPTFLREGLVVTSLIWSILAIIGFLFIGLFVFNETLSTVQWIGVGLGVGSLIILAVAH